MGTDEPGQLCALWFAAADVQIAQILKEVADVVGKDAGGKQSKS